MLQILLNTIMVIGIVLIGIIGVIISVSGVIIIAFLVVEIITRIVGSFIKSFRGEID
ncbi:hypothetical protein [Streptococcus parauberis]|uniref:hypothetical protein n=1 Tax=Streptococcus parauberis TaxID=1348 RepID=UPI000E3AE108|nr:hypothetical protein [Streptococcus parauberis]RFE01085.1 hypothetical protein ADO06_01958 [Streptococcus parauberis]